MNAGPPRAGRQCSATDAEAFTFRDPRSFAADLARLAQHYASEAERLRQEARDAMQAARECRQWAANVRQGAASCSSFTGIGPHSLVQRVVL